MYVKIKEVCMSEVLYEMSHNQTAVFGFVTYGIVMLSQKSVTALFN